MFTVGGWFGHSDLQVVLEAIKVISNQIASIEQDMMYFFSKMLSAVKQDACFERLSKYERKVKIGAHLFQLYVEN